MTVTVPPESVAWSTERRPAPRVRPELKHSVVVRGLEVKVTRFPHGSVVTSVTGKFRGRHLSVATVPGWRLSDDVLQADAVELANQLADAGFGPE